MSAALAAALAAAAFCLVGGRCSFFSPSVEGSTGSTETLLERRDERRLDSGAGGIGFGSIGEGDADLVARVLAGAAGGTFFGFSLTASSSSSSSSSVVGFFACALIVHGAKSFACIPGDTERCLVNPLFPISGIFGPSTLFLFGTTGGLFHVFAAFCFGGGTYGAAFIVISPGGGTNFFCSFFTSPSSASSSFAFSPTFLLFGAGGGANTFFSTFSLALSSFSLVHSFVAGIIIAARSLSIGPSYSL